MRLDVLAGFDCGRSRRAREDNVTRKAIFITGGGSGIGRATAQLFAARGWFVGIADVNAQGIDETAALLPEVLPLIERGQLRPQEVTTRVVRWEDAAEAFTEPSIKLVVRRDS